MNLGHGYSTKRSKYGNSRSGGYDSRKEARRAQELELLQRAGAISNLQRQVKFVLIETQREPDRTGPSGGKRPGKVLEKECSYYADFTYYDSRGRFVVEDCKGMRTKDYVIKRKLMLERYKIRILET